MEELNSIIKFVKSPFLWGGVGLFAIILLIMIIGGSSSDSSFVINNFFKTPFPNVTNFTITSRFGNRIDPLDNTQMNFHNAVDIDAPDGTEIVASADGFVVSYVVTESGGETVTIEHNFGGIIYRTIYVHMLEDSVVVVAGQEIKAKEKIGIIGMSGTRVTGVHLHFSLQELDVNSGDFRYIDPINIFEK